MLARTIARGKTFEFFADESEFMAAAAKTPRSNCVLDNSKARNAGLRLPHVCDAIERALQHWIPADVGAASGLLAG
jgi:UDP-glucose 4,6-dehydratase